MRCMEGIVFDFYNVIYLGKEGSLDLEVIKILENLYSDGIPLYLFTNTRKEKIKEIEEHSGISFIRFFKSVISNKEYLKPDLRSFEYLLRETKLLPQKILFIDDSQDNVTVAESFGINAYLYTNPKELKAVLEKNQFDFPLSKNI